MQTTRSSVSDRIDLVKMPMPREALQTEEVQQKLFWVQEEGASDGSQGQSLQVRHRPKERRQERCWKAKKKSL